MSERDRLPWVVVILRMWYCVWMVCIGLCSTGFAQNRHAQNISDGVLEGWVVGEFSRPIEQISPSSTHELEKILIEWLRFPQPPADLRYNLSLREFQGFDPKLGTETYRYPVATDTLDFNVDVSVRATSSGWEAYRVRVIPPVDDAPVWLSGPGAFVVFSLLSLWILVELLRPSGLRLLLGRAIEQVKPYKKIVWVTHILLYGSFILGAVLALGFSNLSKEVADWLSGNVEGWVKGSGFVFPQLTLYWNFLEGAVGNAFIPGVFLGIPALLIGVLRLWVMGFAFSPAGMPWLTYLLHIPMLVVELQAYSFIVISALVGAIRTFKVGWWKALNDYGYSLIPAFVLLWIAAWYEAAISFLTPWIGGAH